MQSVMLQTMAVLDWMHIRHPLFNVELSCHLSIYLYLYVCLRVIGYSVIEVCLVELYVHLTVDPLLCN